MKQWKTYQYFVFVPLAIIAGYVVGVATVDDKFNVNSILSGFENSRHVNVAVAGSVTNGRVEKSSPTYGIGITDRDAEISSLVARVDVLKAQIKNIQEEKENASLYACLVNTLANGVSDATLTSLIASSSPFSMKDMEKVRDPVGFAVKLSLIASGNNYDNVLASGQDQFHAMNFNSREKNIEGQSEDVFSSSQGKIFIHFSLPDSQYDKVLIKWYDPSTNDVILFKTFAINPDDDTHYIWLSNNKPWDEGRYVVEIYAPDESLQLLTAGNYYVVN